MESFSIAIKKKGNRDIKLHKMTLEDVELFQMVLTHFKNLMSIYDAKCTIDVFESSAAFKSIHTKPILHVVTDELEKANNREPIRPGALKEMSHLQAVISNSPYEFEIGIGRRGKVIKLNHYFKTDNRFKKPLSTRGKAENEVVFLNGELRSLDDTANIHIAVNEDIIKVDCEERARARKVRNYYDAEVFVSAIQHSTPKTTNSYFFVDNYRTIEEMTNIQNFYSDYKFHRNEERYSLFIDQIDTILDQDKDLNLRLYEIRKYVNLFDNDFTDEGQLFTIATSLQQFDSNEILEPILNRNYQRLKKKTNFNF